MSAIKIEWLHDYHDCETCGGSSAEGARVTIDGIIALEFEPIAHCFDGQHWMDTDVYRAILRHFGHEVIGLRFPGDTNAE